MNTEAMKLAVVGGGSWGTALANLLAVKGFPISLWVFESEVREQIETHGENQVFLPGVRLSDRLTASNDLNAVVSGKDLVLLVTPSHVTRAVSSQMADSLDGSEIIVSASKGIENETHLTMCEVLKETLPMISSDRIAVLHGPSFAKEVAVQSPTVVTAAAPSTAVAEQVQHVFATPYFSCVYQHRRHGR